MGRARAGLVVLGGLVGLTWVVTRACAEPPDGASPEYTGADVARPKIPIALRRVGEGFEQPTDVQAVPGHPGLVVVLEKTGAAKWLELDTGKTGVWFQMEVLTRSEQGLLGLAFHPQYAANRRFFVHASISHGGKPQGELSRWVAAQADPRKAAPRKDKVLLRVEQPYANHDGGQLQFGPDGKLYAGFGDGGAANDPLGHGQKKETPLGSMLRLDVDAGDPYAVPSDNPWGTLVWAYGLRNPWRFSFAPDGRLVAGDVGQNKWEEVTIVGRGENHGWNVREAFHCFPPGAECSRGTLTDPIYEYGRDEGTSITGGYVYRGESVPELKGRYVFADFTTGRLWALELPPPGGRAEKVWALGRWPLSPATFGVDHAGELYVADFSGGGVYRVVAP